ncbi:MAG: hypothetical protein LBR92_01305 [Puniceicoccales bacterium]|jgi:hypothetical protein|nr:hypothetical protein [Puniceicoccales bacterium]
MKNDKNVCQCSILGIEKNDFRYRDFFLSTNLAFNRAFVAFFQILKSKHSLSSDVLDIILEENPILTLKTIGDTAWAQAKEIPAEERKKILS